MATADISRRPERADDAAFRFALFRDSRHPCERLPGIDTKLADQLLRHQFAGQETSYRTAYPDARHDIVEVGGTPAGRIVVDEGREGWTLVDIALGAAWRGRGIGTWLLAEAMTGAQIVGVSLRLRVMIFNTAAMRLYARLGFVASAAHDVDIEMVWAPSCPASLSAASAYPDRLRLPLAIDAAAMAADVARLDDRHWIAHYVPYHYDGDWSVLPLRAKAGATHPVMTIVADPACRDFEDTPLLDACPAIRAALSGFRCPLLAVRLMRLAPGASIKEHVDPDLSFEQGHVRLHVPVTTNEEVDVRLNGSRVTMTAGTVWYLRLSDPHSVANRGTTARVHLVIDAAVNPWLQAIFATARAEAA